MWYFIWNRSAQHWLKKTFTAYGYNFLELFLYNLLLTKCWSLWALHCYNILLFFCQYWTAGEGYGASSKKLILSVKSNEVLTDFPSSDLPDYHLEYQNDKTEMKYDKTNMFLLLMQLRNITTTKCRLCLVSAPFIQWKDGSTEKHQNKQKSAVLTHHVQSWAHHGWKLPLWWCWSVQKFY